MKRSYDRIDSCGLTLSHSSFTPHWKVSGIVTKTQSTNSTNSQKQKDFSTIDWNAKPAFTPQTKSKMLLCSTLTKWTFVFQFGVPSLGKIFQL